ncbi:hypothetical protein ICS_05694 [Bacillus cereus BAG2O-3]|nr:hypothetical protein ICS_05694 [Bacillus cereus BAG2O-3]
METKTTMDDNNYIIEVNQIRVPSKKNPAEKHHKYWAFSSSFFLLF